MSNKGAHVDQQTTNTASQHLNRVPLRASLLDQPGPERILAGLAHERKFLTTNVLPIAAAMLVFLAALNALAWWLVPNYGDFMAMHTLAAGTVCGGAVIMALLSLYTARLRGR